MKKILFMLAALPVGMACFGEERVSATTENQTATAGLQDNAALTYKFVTLAEAEKVLGEKAHVKDSSWKSSGGIARFFSTIVAIEADKKTGKTKRLFFSYEQHPQESTAKELYASIKAENEKTTPATVLAGTGDEAFWVKDFEGNPFMMIRKGNKIFKLKIYNVPDKNAFERLKSLAKRVVTDN